MMEVKGFSNTTGRNRSQLSRQMKKRMRAACEVNKYYVKYHKVYLSQALIDVMEALEQGPKTRQQLQKVTDLRPAAYDSLTYSSFSHLLRVAQARFGVERSEHLYYLPKGTS